MSTDNIDQQTPTALPPVVIEGMTTAEKIYTAAVIVCAILLLIPLCVFHLMLIPQSPNPYAFYFVTAILWLVVLSVAITSAINLYYCSLLIIPTIIQCITVSFMIYFSPVGIWGGYLLYRRIQRSKGNVIVTSTVT